MESKDRNASGSDIKNEYDQITNAILKEFRTICGIPHGSGFEDGIGEHLKMRLRTLGAKVSQDEAGNILGEIPATPGLEDAPIVVLQAHMDMVVAGDIPIEEAVVNTIEENGVLHTDGHTTLGADNGIGVATILTLLELETKCHGPLRVLFTVSEEVGLKGAKAVSPDWLEGAKYMINTDGFHSDTEVVGCKGGLRETFSRKIQAERLIDKVRFFSRKKNQLDETELYEVKLQGYLGGHSGDDIDKGRCNTICQLAEMLQDIQDRYDMRISCIKGGTGYNVIPAECTAVVAVPKICRLSVAKLLVKEEHELQHEYEKADPTGTLTVRWLGETSKGNTLWEYRFQRDVLHFLTDMHKYDGVETTNKQGVVTSSSNLGQIFSKDGVLYIGDMVRCDTSDQEDMILGIHGRVSSAFGFDVDIKGYHGWHSSPTSRLACVVADVYEGITGEPIKREIAKVGLEPAYFHSYAPDMDIVCLGAEIENAHSVKESVKVQSIELLYELMLRTIQKLSEE